MCHKQAGAAILALCLLPWVVPRATAQVTEVPDAIRKKFNLDAEAAPQARQVADRFHLLKNAREALERFLDRLRDGSLKCSLPRPKSP
jgi:hypothetical protein